MHENGYYLLSDTNNGHGMGKVSHTHIATLLDWVGCRILAPDWVGYHSLRRRRREEDLDEDQRCRDP
jgi:hypothetical protein